MELREIKSLNRHPALKKLGIDPLAQRTPEYDAIGVRRIIRPIQITPNGDIIEGEDRVEAAKAQGMTEVWCEVYDVSKGDSLILLLRECRELRGLSQACRIELALLLEGWLTKLAQQNQISGKKLDLSPNLAEDPHIDVRKEIARIAFASAGNVDKVRRILKCGTEELKHAVRAEEISINAGDKICQYTLDEQTREVKARLESKVDQRLSQLLPAIRQKDEPLHAFVIDLQRSFKSLKTKCELRSVVDSIGRIVDEIEAICGRATPKEQTPG
jgi:hypothetical protein